MLPPLSILQAVGGGGPEALSESLRLLEMPAPWIVALLLVPGAFCVAFIGYWREDLTRGWRALLVGLRFLSLLVLLLVLFRPVKVHRRENVQPAEVVLLLDDSASMSRRDAYSSGTTAAELEQASGLDASRATRLELARAILDKQLIPLLSERDYRLRTFRFDDTLAPISDLGTWTGHGAATHIGDGLARALRAHRGRHVTDVVIVSDGKQNGGLPALDAAREAQAAGIPVHTLVVGDTRPELNLSIELIEAPDNVLEGDEVSVQVRLDLSGDRRTGSTEVLLEDISDEGRGARVVDSVSVQLDKIGDRLVLVAPPESAGLSITERRFRLSTPPLQGETLVDDNAIEFAVQVTPEKVRVLFLDGYPRWEYRFLNRMLKRADERLEVQCWLLSATSGFLQESSQDLPSLKRLPSSRRELLDNYDVVILGDINPYNVSPDPAVGEEFVASLFEFVERGGGLCLIAGEYDNPKSIAGTEFAELLPVNLDTTGALTFDGDATRQFRPVLEDPAAPHEIVRLHPQIELNRRLWEEPGGLKGFYWYAPIVDAKPGAQVLLRHPTDTTRSGERTPLLVTGYYPAGRTMFLGVDSTWRWRFRYVDRYHERFWRNAMRWLALGRLKSGDRRYQLQALRNTYAIDERATLEARVLDDDFRPSGAHSVEVALEDPEGERRTIGLVPMEGRPGLFQGNLDGERPGTYRAWIERDGKRVASAEFEVVLPSRENNDPAPSPETLAAMATVSGGLARPLAQAGQLAEAFPGGEERREPISSELEDAWDHWGTLLLALGLLTAEWLVRKRRELI